ncbi:MAG: VTC domain-containing protein [Deltaproteobacteria bacterium]|nr:VTC domain-containing protein [Deltaproteobacteria bacterium]MBI2347085.1 VTC domain-containing protein [Deltaproteobacteria bacterium]
MKDPIYQDRIEKKFQVGISDDGVAGLWRDLSSFLPRYGLTPIPKITSVSSVYFDNKDYDLLRYILLIERRWILVRLRTYEDYGRSPEPISEYWMEVKTKEADRRKKRRFRLSRETLPGFLEGKDVEEQVLAYNDNGADPHLVRRQFHEARETVLTLGLKPILLVTYKRVAFQNDVERLTLEWDVRYYHVGTDVYFYDSFKYPVEEPAGKADKIILELKYLQGSLPAWFSGLQRRYPIWERDYLKPLEGMGFLFQGPLKHHKEANSFLQMKGAYMGETEPLG